MPPKKIHKNDITGGRGVNLIERVVLEMGCLWYPTGGVEAGVDGFIEIRDTATGNVTNSIIQVQSKATTVAFQAETDDCFDYLCDAKDLDYWMNGNAPVILVVSRPDTNEAYWVSVKDYFQDLTVRHTRKVRFNKKRDLFDKNCHVALVRIAMPRDAGIYLAPPPRIEALYSNLLPVTSFPDTIFVADTPFRYAGSLWKVLRELSPYIEGGWYLSGKQIITFEDLNEFPWNQVCDQGSITPIDTQDWVETDDPSIERDFVSLLNLSLKEMMWREHVRYNEVRDLYYFRATDDLSPRRIPYKSLQKNVHRNVFEGYPNKPGATIIYYRHSAFEGIFRRFDNNWFLEITPTYYYTVDGAILYKKYEQELKGMKSMEKNAAVLGQLVMWASILSRPRDLFNNDDLLLEFGKLPSFKIAASIDDKAWLDREDEETKKETESSLDDLNLFSDES